jgi:hypothetical protein
MNSWLLKLSLPLLLAFGAWLIPAAAVAFPAGTHAAALANAALSAQVTQAKRPARKGRKRPAATKKPPAAPAAAVPPPPPPPPNVKLRATLAAAMPVLTEGIGWRVLKAKPEGPVKEDSIVWTGGGAEPSFHLEPGRYYVEAIYGFARRGQDIEIPAEGMAESTIALEAGTILARGAATPGGQPLDDMFYVLRMTDDVGTPGVEVGRSSLPQATFHVPAGKYRLSLQHGLARTEIPVVVAAGQEVKADGVLNSGHLKLTATASQGGPILDDAVFFVYAEDNSGNQREIARSELSEAEFDLPAGRYRIAALWGLARVERQIAIKPGANLAETLILDAGTVKLTSLLAGSNAPLDRLLIYKVYAMSQDQGSSAQSVATSAKPAPVLYLRSGKYRIESQYGWHNARQTREVDVAAGQTAELAFEHRASEVTLKLTAEPGKPALGRVKWTVKYANGGTVLISQDNTPSLILQAGSYQVVAQHGAKTYSRAFEANANEVHTIELVAD